MIKDEQINRWAAAYENEICAKYEFIAARLSIPIESGRSEYQLPNYVTNIRMVLYKGKELHAKSGTVSQITQDTPFATTGSVPYEYVYSGKGQRVLKFYPTPMENIPVYMGDLWTPEADAASLIVEFYRTPNIYNLSETWGSISRFSWGQLEQYSWGNLTTTLVVRLPRWMRRNILKNYICLKAFSMEGPDQDLRASRYYDEVEMTEAAMYLSKVKENMTKYHMNVLSDKKLTGRQKPGRPILPPNFGRRANW